MFLGVGCVPCNSNFKALLNVDTMEVLVLDSLTFNQTFELHHSKSELALRRAYHPEEFLGNEIPLTSFTPFSGPQN